MFKIIKISLILVPVILTACSSNISGRWSCEKAKSKFGCVSSQEIEQVYSGKIESKKNKVSKAENKKRNRMFGLHNVHRTSEKIARIWIAPYIDTAGIYHEARIIKVVEELSKWEGDEGN